MQTATLEKTKTASKANSRVIDLGNGVMFPVKNEVEADFVEWMIERAKAGSASLPTKAPGTFVIPARSASEPKMSSEEFWAFYESERADRF